MVIIAVMLAALIGLVAILVVFRKRTKSSGISVLHNNDGIDSLKELDNPIYSSGKQPCACFSKSKNNS